MDGNRADLAGAAGRACGRLPPLDESQLAILSRARPTEKALPKARLALMAGYSMKVSGFNNALSRLRTTRGSKEGDRQAIAATALGVEAMDASCTVAGGQRAVRVLIWCSSTSR
jgi:hypothetical protein